MIHIIDEIGYYRPDIWQSEILLDKYTSGNIKKIEGFFSKPKKVKEEKDISEKYNEKLL